MEPYIQISLLNDFIFCPKSIYFHNLYAKYRSSVYHVVSQTVGTIHHESIEEGRYSTELRYIQAMPIYSEQYNICGKIDVYDRQKFALIERKSKIKKIYDGYRYQMFAQYFCMREMGFGVIRLFMHSLSDNKRYAISFPSGPQKEKFESLLDSFRTFDIADPNFTQNPRKCEKCIYRQLCDTYTENITS